MINFKCYWCLYFFANGNSSLIIFVFYSYSKHKNSNIEKEVKRKAEHEVDAMVTLSNIAKGKTRDVTVGLSSFQRETLKKMKSITDASDDACISILSGNGFKLNDSIERFYRGER